MNAIILSIGDELILGQNVDTNSAWLSRELAGVGCAITAHLTVPDNQRAIESAIDESGRRGDFLIITGGIGPTPDDLTRQALAAVMGEELVLSEAWLGKLREFFVARGRPMPESNKIQAMIPAGATMIENGAGTAAGIDATLSFKRPAPDRSTGQHACRVFVMPGVPKEMKAMFARDVLPHIRAATATAGGGAAILSRALHTFGMGESAVAERLGDLMRRDRNPTVGTTVSGGVVTVRINSAFDSRQRAAQELQSTEDACRAALGDLIWGQDEQTLQEVVGRMLIERGTLVTTAESCTAGLLAKMLTDVSGSSGYFNVGFITYSNQAKYERLGVSMEMINLYGAVSEPVAQAMASNARRLAKADVALAISGVAGPTGGTPVKPVGMVCIALVAGPRNDFAAGADRTVQVRTFNFPGDRDWIRDRAAKMALTMLRYHLIGKTMPF